MQQHQQQQYQRHQHHLQQQKQEAQPSAEETVQQASPAVWKPFSTIDTGHTASLVLATFFFFLGGRGLDIACEAR